MLPATLTTSQHFIQSFSWMLLHSLWQGVLLAVLSGILLVLTKKSSSVVRYNLLFSQLSVFIIACVLTFAWEWNKSPVPGVIGAVSHPEGTHLLFSWLSADGLRHFAEDCIYRVSANATMIVLVWLLLFIVRSVRLMGSLVYVHRARHRFVYQPPGYWTDKVEGLRHKLQLNKAVKLLESGYVKMPMVIGHLKPIILVPIGLIAGLPAGQVEAILLHELAHIRRQDYIVNVLQTIVETIFCFNPGLLWMSSVLRDERENCCDDIALAQTKNKKEFVQALISFKEHALYGTSYQVAFPGKKNHLLNRVSRIIGNKNPAFGLPEKASFITGLLILATMITTAAITRAHHVRHSGAKPHDRAAQTTPKINYSHTTETVVNSSARKVRIAPAAKPTSTDSVSATSNDSSGFVAEHSVDRIQPIVATDTKTLAVVAQQDRKTRTEDPATEKLQADEDREQAQKEQAQAILDQEQAKRDQVHALKDREQAVRDQEQAKRDQQNETTAKQNHDEVSARQMKLNELQDVKNLQQDAQNEEQARRNEEQARLNKIQQEKNREQSVKNEEQAQLNKIQEQKNAEQAKRNEQQTKLNEQQEKKNEAAAAINNKQAQQNSEQAKQNKVSVQQ